ncbi:MAG: hypothetical protein HQ517_04050 [SAR324 cluster bacterium]|nr:hypothetical protein [SAR324 cluster bacterium]
MNRLLSINRFFTRKLGLSLIAVFCGFIFSTGCTPKKVDPMSFPILDADEIEAQYPPTEEELVLRPYILLPLIVFKDQTVTESRLNDILNFVHSSFEKYGNFSIISQSQTDALLAREENKRFQTSNIADAIQLGTTVNATHISQMQITIIESKMVDNVDIFKANINLTVFTTDSGQVVIKQDISYDAKKPEQSYKKLKQLVQTYFQIRGYILETRGAHQVAKISLGRSVGIELDRKMQIRDRIVKSEIVSGISRKTVSFEVNILTTVEVIKVMENDCWVLVNKKDQHKIKKGQVVFTLPD